MLKCCFFGGQGETVFVLLLELLENSWNNFFFSRALKISGICPMLLENVKVRTVTTFITIFFLASQLFQLIGEKLINLNTFSQFRSVLSFLCGFIKFAFSVSAMVKSYNQMLPASYCLLSLKFCGMGNFLWQYPYRISWRFL